MSDPTNAQLAAARVYMRGAAAEIDALPQFEKHVQQLEDKFKTLKDLGGYERCYSLSSCYPILVYGGW